MGDEGSRPVSVARVAETPRKSVGPEFERGHWSFFACRLFLLSCDFHEYGYSQSTSTTWSLPKAVQAYTIYTKLL